MFFVSPRPEPSVIPDIVDLAIGNSFLNLRQMVLLEADALGLARFVLPPVGVGPFEVHWQAVTLDLGDVQLPLETSNVQTMMIR